MPPHVMKELIVDYLVVRVNDLGAGSNFQGGGVKSKWPPREPGKESQGFFVV